MPGFQWVSLLSTTCLHGMHKDSFTFTLLLLSYLIIYLTTLSQLYCVLAYTSISSVLTGCGGGQESCLYESPQWMGFSFCRKWYSDTDTDASGWQRERSAKCGIGNTVVVWNSLNVGCSCFEFLEKREGKCQCIRLNESSGFRVGKDWLFGLLVWNVCLFIVCFTTLLLSQVIFELVTRMRIDRT